MLYEKESLLVKFTRETFREELECLGRSSQWIGYILRLLNQKYSLLALPVSSRLWLGLNQFSEKKGWLIIFGKGG